MASGAALNGLDLPGDELLVVPGECEKFLVGSHLDEFAAVHYHDRVGAPRLGLVQAYLSPAPEKDRRPETSVTISRSELT